MKKTIEPITVVIGIVLLLFLGCTKLKDHPKLAMPRADLQRTGVYNTRGVHELGRLKWEFKIEEVVPSSAIIFDRVIYFGASDGYLHAVDANTGCEKWRFKTEGELVSDPAIADGVVYFGSSDVYFYAIDIDTRQEKWKFKTEDITFSSPAISDGVVYFSDGSHLYALDKETGHEKWKFEAKDLFLGHSPAISDGVVYGVAYFGRYNFLYALDEKTGQEKWKFKLEAPVSSSPAISDETVCFGTSDGYLHAVDSNTGQEKWRFKTEDVVYDPAIANGIVYVGGSSDSCLYAIDISTGQEKWKFKTETWDVSSPSIADGIVYFGTWDGCLYAVDANTGCEKWKFKTEYPVVSPPAIADGILYFQDREGVLYALEGRMLHASGLEREKEQEGVNMNKNTQLDGTITMPSAFQRSLFLNNSYGERAVDIYVTVFEKDHKISEILLKVYNYQGIINFMAYAPEIDLPQYPEKPYPLCGLIICLPLEYRGENVNKLPEVLKTPQYPGTWKEYRFHYGPKMCMPARPQTFPSISDILSGKAKLCIRLGGHAFTIDNLETLSQR
jgi:outer membrane protein assembly factor BamB